MKVRVGAAVNRTVVHTVSVTQDTASDINHMPALLREDDQAILAMRPT